MAAPSYAFVSLVSSDSYLPGALTLAAALKDVHPSPPLSPEVHFQTVCLVTPETVDVSTIKLLRQAFDLVIGVETILQTDHTGLVLLGRLDLKTVLTKLHVFRLTQFSKIIFLDADILPIRPLSHLFTLPHEFSASPDVGWPDIFNSGMMVLTPGQDKFNELTELLKSKGSWDGGDQGLLNEWRGNNWNRLSFTYNTTPTAAYTYAPAYERFGSQISAIHFIGPNKPWNSLSFRSPFSSQSIQSAGNAQQAYDYDSLVDKWFDVYDNHYRSHSNPRPQFETKRYDSAWNHAAAPPLSEDVLTLEDLRRLAIEGMNASIASPYDHLPRNEQRREGQYQSMPLEGRVDLMPPKVEPLVEQVEPTINTEEHGDKKRPKPLPDITVEEDPHTPIARTSRLPGESPMRWHTLPTPNPNELPPSPHPQPIPLPPLTPGTESSPSIFPSFGALAMPDSPSNRPSKLKSRQEHGDTFLSPLPGKFFEPEQRHLPPPRPHSPTMLLWNPATEPPPTETPAVTAFPTSTYFANAWDSTPSPPKEDQHQTVQGPRTPVPDSSALFEPLPRPEIPESLIKQGHYRNVTGEDQGTTPSPDTTKIKPVFPWEEKPRHFPGRVFPSTDSPKPSLFLSPESQSSRTSSELPTTPETKPANPPPVLSPLPGFPTSMTYTNAWDTVPSIQHYAHRLAHPPVQQPLAPPFEEALGKMSKKSWDERTDVSSMDGDVEDEGDDSEEEKRIAEIKEKKQGRSRRGSSAPTIRSERPRYCEVGVQTIQPEMKTQAVQTNTPSVSPQNRNGTTTAKKPTLAGRRYWAPASPPNAPPSLTVHAAESAREGSPTSATAEALLRSPQPGLRSPPSIEQSISSPQMIAVTRPSRSASVPQTSTVPPSVSPAVRATAISRQTSTESSLASPASSAGPISPSEGQSVNSPMRKAGRVWDPARGVELFKRGSEEVLARFLKMGSWEDE